MHATRALSDTHEMYLKALHQVRSDHRVARVGELAEALGVSPGTVTGVLKKLKKQGFVDHEPYGVVTLTATGSAVAECLLRRYDTLTAVLTEVFGVDPETAEADACMMEHAASPTTINRMRLLLEAVRQGRCAVPADLASTTPDLCGECEVAGECQAAAGTGR